MRHGNRGRKLGRSSSHRKAMFTNLVIALLQHEQIKTTVAKAKDVRPITERLITLGKKGSLHARRQALAQLQHEFIVTKLFGELAKRYKDRHGGYIRILKAGFRYGDYAPMAIIELVERNQSTKEKKKKSETETPTKIVNTTTP